MRRLCSRCLARRGGVVRAGGWAGGSPRGAIDRPSVPSASPILQLTIGMHAVRTRLSWLGLGLFLLLAGWVGPDSLGPGHGEYLPQRVELLGLAALVPAVDFKISTRWGRLAMASLAGASLLQTLIVWDYALYSDRTAGQMMRATDLAGRGQRIATLLIGIRGRFRANPLLHADWLAGRRNRKHPLEQLRGSLLLFSGPVPARDRPPESTPVRGDRPQDRPRARQDGRLDVGRDPLSTPRLD